MNTTTLPVPAPDHRAPLAIAVWALAAVGLALAHVITPATMPLVPVSIFTLFVASVIAYRRSAALRTFARAIDLRIPIAYHAIRIPFGIAFLVMQSRGELDAAFGMRAGIGDILAGALAIAATISLTVRPSWRAPVWIFNVVGLLDILVALVTAQWTLFVSDHPETMYPLQAFPFPTIPFFVVPMILATHVLVFARLGRESGQRLS